ncbi:MAG: methyltransferase domain-containing protein [Desulfobacteraceae bacterium]|nr:MAG: methyltransferase domain-containing protein [Desulfobacteraceae bacterium]
MNPNEQIREMVSTAYGKAISSTVGGCGCGCSPQKEKGSIIGMAGYETADILPLNSDAAASSFGCGNPLAFSGVKEGDTVLDLGSGAGFDLILAARKVGPTGRIIGVDMTEAMIAKARENISKEGLTNVEVRYGLIENLPVESGSVDWVISNCVINLSPEKGRVFSEIHRVLKPGGQMLVSDIVAKNLPDWFRQDTQAYAACVGGAISEEDYLAGLREAGMNRVEVKNRFVYDASQIQSFFETGEIPGLKEMIAGEPAQNRDDLIQQMTMNAVGNVWSAEFYAKKPAEKMKRSKDETIHRMIQLAGNKYNCSQIMMSLALEQRGHENPGLVRAMSGLGLGCSNFNETCGVMTSAASILAWYGGKGADNEAESEKLFPMLQELGEWFRQKTASKFKGTSCTDIVGDQAGTPAGKQICGALIFETYNKVNEILAAYGFTDKQMGG